MCNDSSCTNSLSVSACSIDLCSHDGATNQLPLQLFDRTDRLLHQIFECIELNYYDESFSLRTVAQAVGYTPAHLTTEVRKRTGKTVGSWFRARRLAAARRLLLETEYSNEQIAAKVGYRTLDNFYRQFRKHHQSAPGAWREANRRT